MTTLILADDHAIFRQGLAQLLSSSSFNVLGQAGNGAEAWQLIQKFHPQVAILDISMPSPNGLELAARIAKEAYETYVILLTMHDDPTLADEAKRSGVRGYVLKDNTFEELIHAVSTVASGEIYLSKQLQGKVNFISRHGLSRRKSVLSPREREVLKNIAQGYTNKETARILEVSPKTVETHRSRIMAKLNLHSTAELVRYAVKVGLVS
ncbi:response regulator [Magnetococcales bacterium HHB-1]